MGDGEEAMVRSPRRCDSKSGAIYDQCKMVDHSVQMRFSDAIKKFKYVSTRAFVYNFGCM